MRDRADTGPISGMFEVFRHTCVERGRNHGRLPVDVTGFLVEMEGGGYSLPG